MEFTFTDIISLLFSFSAIILIVFLLGVKTDRPLSNRLLAFYLFFSIFDSSSQFLSLWVYAKSPIVGMLISETVFFLIPLFYLFVKSSVYKDFNINTKSLVHLLPYVLINLLMLPGYFLPLLKNPQADWVALIYDTNLYQLIYFSIHAQQYVYYLLIFLLLRKYKKLLLENFSSPRIENQHWLMQITLVFFINEVVAMFKNILRFTSSMEIYMISQNLVSAMALLIMIWLIFKALRNPHIFSGVKSDIPLSRSMAKEKQISGNMELIDRLKEYMTQNEPFFPRFFSYHARFI